MSPYREPVTQELVLALHGAPKANWFKKLVRAFKIKLKLQSQYSCRCKTCKEVRAMARWIYGNLSAKYTAREVIKMAQNIVHGY